jgi:glycosyltransferase involved in cell wall biosynthesis
MIKISAVIITLNEERNIGRCLDSLQGVVDEIVVVDSLSKDKTKEICLQRGVTFIEHPFEGYIEQQQWAVLQATNNIILCIDADEALTPELQKSISSVKNDWKYAACSFNRLNYYCGVWIRHSSWYPDKKIRLFDRRLGEWGGENPHYRFILKDSKSVVKHLHGDLLHYSFYTLEESIFKLNKYTSIGAKVYFDKGKRSSLFKIIFNPFWTFFRNYFFKLGFLDGFQGFVLCMVLSFSNFIKYCKLRELQNNKK